MSIQLLKTKLDQTFELTWEGEDLDRACNRKNCNLYHNHRSANGLGDHACVRLYCIANRRVVRNVTPRPAGILHFRSVQPEISDGPVGSVEVH